MSNRIAYIICAVLVLVMIGTMVWASVATEDDRLDDEQCIRRGYVRSLDLWGMKFCVKIVEGKLRGEQLE